jgi:Leucine-rich repeat (LRR) protein
MSTTKILRQGLSSLLKSNIIEILAGITDTEKALDLLKQNFTFTHSEIAKNFQDSYGYALAAISSGLAAPENQRGFWRSLFQSNVESEFSQGLEQDYLLPFAQQQGLADEKLSAFRQTAVAQCQQMATLTLFEADNAPFSETELASFVTASGASSMTDLVVELVQTQQSLDKRVMAFLQFEELLGNALLFFLHEQLRKEPRFQSTLSALQREGLIIDVREIKQIVQSTENKLNQALTKKQFGEVAQLGQQLERLQQIESVTQTHYAQFLEFSQRFADWAQLVNVQLKQVLAALPKLQAQLGGIKSDTEEILTIVQQLMTRADLSPQVKPRDELTQYNSANLELIEKPLLKQHSSPKLVEKPIQPEQARIIKIDKREWWKQLDDDWQEVFKKAIAIKRNPTDNDLEKIVNLQELDCRLNYISHLESLRALTNLQTLDCSINKISDLEPLRTLTNLQTLNCSGNKISDLEPLRALTNLQTLDCSWNKVNNLEPLHTLTNLQVLNCSRNQISKLVPLHALTNLQVLNCSYNYRIGNLKPLRALTKLQILNCNKNQIRDLEPLRALTNLQTLNCNKNQLHDLEPLRALTNLQTLNCWGNKISDLELEKFKQAAHHKNFLSDSDNRKWWNQLNDRWKNIFNKTISIDGEPTDSDLEKIVNLQTLDCCWSKIKSLEPLRALTNLRELYCSNNKLTQAEINKFKKAVPNCKVYS